MKKPTTHILMTLLLLMVWQGDLMAGNITLYKKVGANYFLIKNVLAPTFGTTPAHTPTNDATEEFNEISDAMQNDFTALAPLNGLADEYFIHIEAVPNEKYFVGKQSNISVNGSGIWTYQISPNGCFTDFNNNIIYAHNVTKKIILLGVSNAPLLSNTSASLTSLIPTPSKVNIKYFNDLYFGAWNAPINNTSTGPTPNSNSQSGSPTQNTAAHIGSFVFFIGCVGGVHISNLEIDGSVDELITNGKIGGLWGDKGYQCWHYGIWLDVFSNSSIENKIDNVVCKKMALDGFAVGGNNINITNCLADYNTRQGLTVYASNHLKVTDCEFNHTANYTIWGAPGSGMDIEPTGGIAENGLFTNCKFIGNANVGIVTDGGSNAIEIKNMKFINCEVESGKSGQVGSDWGVPIWIGRINFEFEKCIFRGNKSSLLFNSNDYIDATKFFDCKFYDYGVDGSGVKYPLGIIGYPKTLIEVSQPTPLYFRNCLFEKYYGDANSTNSHIQMNFSTIGSLWPEIKDCNFKVTGSSFQFWPSAGFNFNRFHLTNFIGTNTFNDGLRTVPSNCTGLMQFLSENFYGATTFGNKNVLYEMNGITTFKNCKPTISTVEEGAIFASWNYNNIIGISNIININTHNTLEIKSGAQFVQVAGIIHIENGAKLIIRNGAKYSIAPTVNIIVDAGGEFIVENGAIATGVGGCGYNNGSWAFGARSSISVNLPNGQTPPTVACSCGGINSTATNIITLNNGLDIKNLINQASSSTFSNQTFFVDGSIAIDDDVTFDQCDFYFTAGSQILVQANTTLNIINGSTLKSACGDYWKGIIADDPTAEIIIDNSTIQDMSEGLKISNNAIIQATGNTFVNNRDCSIFLYNITNHFNTKILNNSFTSNSNVISYYNQSIPSLGIVILNCNNLTIGGLANSTNGNHFEKLLCGIAVNASMPDMTMNDPKVELYNNSFKNIHNPQVDGSTYPEGEILNQCYNNPLGTLGSAISIHGYGSAAFSPKVIVKNSGNAFSVNSPTKFEYCDKAILSFNTNLEIQNLKMNNTLLGILCGGATGKEYKITQNKIDNTFLGIQLIGDEANSNISGNRIYSPTNIEYIQRDANHVDWPIGIDVRRYSNTSITNSVIKENTIDIKSWAGIGINMGNTNATTQANNNNITLSSTAYNNNYYHWFEAIEINNPTEPASWLWQEIQMTQNTTLAGINAENAENSLLSKNTIKGQLAMLNAAREDATAISMELSKNLQMECNTIDKTRFGITVKGNCENTSTTAVKGNTMNNHILGWAFRHFGGEGTLGNVGSNSNDNNNNFIGSGYASKVFRFCTTNAFLGTIFSNSLSNFDFNSVNINNANITGQCNYDLGMLNNATLFTCSSLPPIYNISNNSGQFNLEEAIQIINNTRSYAEFEEICHWLDVRELFDVLDANPSIRNSNAQLQSFYNYLLTDVINQLKTTDNSLNSLINVFATNNDAMIQQAILDAKNKNNAIDDTEVQNHYEQEINGIYLNMLENGLSAISADDIEKIETMANSCPMIKGTAVYKARTLNALFNPTQGYDDLKICNSQGVYKTANSNSNGLFGGESDYLKNLKPNFENVILNNNEIKVYPNPTDNILNIRYNIVDNATLIIQDLLGRRVIEINLSNKSNHAMIDVSHLQMGVYIYQMSSGKQIIKSDKIIIE